MIVERKIRSKLIDVILKDYSLHEAIVYFVCPRS
jgi:hypothetical protein